MKRSYCSEYVWKIEHFSTCCPGIENGARIDSEFFECPDRKNVKFRLGFCPNNNKSLGNEWTSIFLWIGCDKSINAIISFELLSPTGAVVLNKSINVYRCKKRNAFLDLQNVYVPANDGRGWGFQLFASRDFIFDPTNNVLDDDILTIRCRIEFSFGDVMVVFNSQKILDDDDDKKVYNAKYLWKIDKFKDQLKNCGFRLDSDFFNCEDKPEIGFRMGLCPNGDILENEGYLSLYLWVGSERTVNTRVIFEMIKNDNTTISKERQQNVSSHEDRGWGFPRFYELKEVLKPESNILKNGCLTIYAKVEFTFVSDITPPPSSLEFFEMNEEMEDENAINSFFEIQESKYFTEFIWKVENFSQINTDIGNRVDSCIFPCTDNPDIRFRLGLNPNGCNDSNKGFLSVYLWIGTSVDISARISVELLNNQNKSMYIKERNDMVPNNCNQGWGFDQFIHRSVVLDQDNGYLENDILTIRCKIFITICEF